MKFRMFLLITSLLVSNQSIAHAGHDHNDSLSGLIHLLWFAPIVIAGAVLASYLKTRFFANHKK